MEVIYIFNLVFCFVVFVVRVDRVGWKKIVLMGWNKGCVKRFFKKLEEIFKFCFNDVYLKFFLGGSILFYFIDF